MGNETPIDPAKLREAFGNMQKALKNIVEVVGKISTDVSELNRRVSGIETLVVQMGAEKGLELHQSFPPKEETVTPEQASEILGGKVLD